MFENSGMENGSSTENSGTAEAPAAEPTPKADKAAKQPKAKAKKAAPKKTAKPSKAKSAKPASKKAATPSKVKATKPAKSTAPVSPTANEMPPVGTVIEKKDRQGNVRAKCKVVEGGVQFEGKTYNSLSSAAMAAAESLGLKSTAQNGWVFWGLKALPPATDPVETLEKLSTRFIERARSAMAGATDENRDAIDREIAKHKAAVGKLAK